MGILDQLPQLPFNLNSDSYSKGTKLSGGGVSSSGQGLSSNNGSGNNKEEVNQLNGIESLGIGARGRARGRFDDEDGNSTLNLVIRGLQTFLALINLSIYIAIASYQRTWGVGPSFLSVLAIIINIQSLIVGALFLVTPLMFEQVSFLRGIARALRQIRIRVISNGVEAILLFLLALITSISAYSGGCKDPNTDDNSQLPGYLESMGSFCRNKRAGAAFFWFNFIAWSITLALALLMWYNIRKYPQSSGFAIPTEHQEDSELVFDSSTPGFPTNNNSSNAGYRPSGDYYSTDQGLFTESAQGYENRNSHSQDQHRQIQEQERYHHPVVVNPFEDYNSNSRGNHFEQEGSHSATGGKYERSYEEADPYEAIRKSMDVNRPSY